MANYRQSGIYTSKSRWKIYLAIAGVLIVIISFSYTSYLSEKLKKEEANKVEHISLSYQTLTDPADNMTLVSKILENNTTTPFILVNEFDGIDGARNFGDLKDSDTTFLRKQLNKIKDTGSPPFVIADEYNTQYLYYKQSKLLTLLNFMPLIQLILISAFIGFGYMAFSSARRTEQNLVWIGMAKETAHQLGTPITAIIAWIEHLKALNTDDEDMQEVVAELQKDVTRLELIAERFSKVGSAPVLEPIDIGSELSKVIEYMKARSPRKVNFIYQPPAAPIFAQLNPPLFDWVIENILRNALDAMSGKGDITIELETTDRLITLLITDTGKGIPASKLKTVFQPGYTTKKRGWGLGLSLSKRIIESYHDGKIFVKSSNMDKGTTFSIQLPLNDM